MEFKKQDIKSFFFKYWWLYYLLFFLFLGLFIYILKLNTVLGTNNRIAELNKRFEDCYQKQLQNDSVRVVNNAGQFGCLSFTLLWNSIDDLDLDVIDANKNQIWFNEYCKSKDNRFSSAGGQLDIDLNAERIDTYQPVENVYFKCTPPNGTYTVRVRAYAKREAQPTNVKLIVRKKGKIIQETSTTIKKNREVIELIKYNYNSNE
jgi:uncharacterized protein YfaP (DUF2135 family)